MISVSTVENICHLYGDIGGGMLEYVKMEVFTKDGWGWIRLYFTNHDVQETKDCIDDCPDNEQHKLVDKQFFVIEVPSYENLMPEKDAEEYIHKLIEKHKKRK